MIVKQLASGSKGNVTLILTKSHNILIDAGIPLKNIEKRIEQEFPKIDILIVTHAHDDHIKGILSYIKKFKPNIYTKIDNFSEKTGYENIINSDLEEEDFSLRFIPLSHDSPCNGVIIREKDKELVYITDTGYINKRVLDKIENKDIYVMESNHDVETLRNGKYPFFLQQRILSDKGHLSNETASKYLLKLVGDKTKYIILAHLSEKNNTEELAINTIKEVFKDSNSNIKKIYIAKQEEALEKIEV